VDQEVSAMAQEQQSFYAWQCFSLIKDVRTHDFKVEEE